jgi:hypothetical protein
MRLETRILYSFATSRITGKARTARLRGAERGAGVPASDEPGFGAEPRLIRNRHDQSRAGVDSLACHPVAHPVLPFCQPFAVRPAHVIRSRETRHNAGQIFIESGRGPEGPHYLGRNLFAGHQALSFLCVLCVLCALRTNSPLHVRRMKRHDLPAPVGRAAVGLGEPPVVLGCAARDRPRPPQPPGHDGRSIVDADSRV